MKPRREPADPEREVAELVARALWDVFSDNHSVVDSDGAPYDLGSFRASAAFIAEVLGRRHPRLRGRYGYLDFYMGTALCGHRADLRPVYRWIFERLKKEGCDWRYSFPRLYLVEFSEREEAEGFLAYDPSDAVRSSLERAEMAEERESLAEALERDHREAIHRARQEPLPASVSAYRAVFGRLPDGWPHPDM